ncbi:NHL domain-containing protein [Hymenobacter terrenus]|uniref:NHL domain-containing protein n=1 Tax=Hymenobacter terrenus TaxID=1629124 RepID=UPI00069822A0|nr:T9SS type A sorting domain-containing protein [Hymenobacter terrenus]
MTTPYPAPIRAVRAGCVATVLHALMPWPQQLALATLALVLLALAPAVAQPYAITTVAGNGRAGFSGDGGPATSAMLSSPYGVAVDGSGNIYIAVQGGNRVRKVSAATGVITTVAGTSATPGFSGDGGPATGAMLDTPRGVAVDGSGNIYIADVGNFRIRKVSAATGVITTLAGTGTAGFSGDGGPATGAMLNSPRGVAVDGNGNIYIADQSNHRVRKVSAATGVITTLAGAGGTGGFSGDGGPATGAMLDEPTGVAVDGNGNIYIADQSNNRVRKVSAATGVITTLAGTGTFGTGNFGDGGPATGAMLSQPTGVAVDGSGNVFIADAANFRIRHVSAATGVITTVAGTGTAGFNGDGGAATGAMLWYPYGVAVDGSGNVFIADQSNQRIRRLRPASVTSTLSALAAASVLLYPNPTSDAFTVHVPAGAGPVQAELVNALGQPVRRPVAAAAFTVETTGLAPGVYTLRLTLAGQPVTKRVVIE